MLPLIPPNMPFKSLIIWTSYGHKLELDLPIYERFHEEIVHYRKC